MRGGRARNRRGNFVRGTVCRFSSGRCLSKRIGDEGWSGRPGSAIVGFPRDRDFCAQWLLHSSIYTGTRSMIGQVSASGVGAYRSTQIPIQPRSRLRLVVAPYGEGGCTAGYIDVECSGAAHSRRGPRLSSARGLWGAGEREQERASARGRESERKRESWPRGFDIRQRAGQRGIREPTVSLLGAPPPCSRGAFTCTDTAIGESTGVYSSAGSPPERSGG
jgi:hypothetical protein